MNLTVKIILGIVIAALVAGGSFYGGTVYGKSQAEAASPTRAGLGGAGFGGGALLDGTDLPEQARAALEARRAAGGGGTAAQSGMTFGEVESIEGDTVIMRDMNDKQIRVQVAETTLVEKYASVTVAELEVGETITVSGNQNADGSIMARSIQAAPAGRFGFGGVRPVTGGQ